MTHDVTSEAIFALDAVAVEPPPPWAQAFQLQLDDLTRNLTAGLAGVQRDVAGLKLGIDDLTLDVADMKKSIRLAYCRPGLLSGLLRNPDACAALLGCCRDLSLMSKSEIVADFVVNDRGAGLLSAAGGDCQNAAPVALVFFGRRKIMRARAEAGVMHSPSGAAIAMGVSSGAFVGGGQPDARGAVRSGALAYRLDAGCLWTRDPDADAAVDDRSPPRVGCNHFVVSVDTLDGERVVVDWGIKQFGEIPPDMRLFV
jgi:hypothetical protein